MLRRLYDWTLDLAGRKNAMTVLGVLTFFESIVFPIPTDIMMAPMILADRSRAWKIALVASVTSVLGGLGGYAIGYFLYETVGLWIVNLYGYQDKLEVFRGYYADWGPWIVAAGAMTPLPFKVVTIASGLAVLNLPVFLIAAAIARSARYLLVCWLFWQFGEPIKAFVERYMGWVAAAGLALLLGGFVLIRYLG